MSESPPIRFVRTALGQRVAYAVHGQGPPLLCVAWWVSHVENDWQDPAFRAFFSKLGEHHTVIRYDRPGSGLSDRERSNVDLPSEVTTLASLIDHLELEQTALFAVACAGPPALAYAADHPERVSQLVFFGSYARGQDIGSASVQDAMQSLVRANWGIASTTLSNLFSPGLAAKERDRLARAQRKAATAEMSARLLALSFEMHAEKQAKAVDQPALVLHRKSDRTIPFAAGCELAACLQNGTLCSLEGNAHLPWYGDSEGASDAILKFLGNEPAPQTDPAQGPCTFARKGDLCHIVYDGKEIHLPYARGIADLAQLLQQPHQEIHVSALWAGATSTELQQSPAPTLDDEALASYQQRLREIEAAIEECETRQLADRVDALRSERDALARELRAAVGLGGRKRALNDATERARKTVSARIRMSLKKIEEAHSNLGKHLQESVKTGTFCCYAPGSDVTWLVTT